MDDVIVRVSTRRNLGAVAQNNLDTGPFDAGETRGDSCRIARERVRFANSGIVGGSLLVDVHLRTKVGEALLQLGPLTF